MSEALDPTQSYVLLFILLIVAGVGVGLAAGPRLEVIGSAALVGIIGFVSGLYTSREETDLFGSLLLTGGATALVAVFLPLTVTWSIAVFLVGFIAGMRSERR
ncbi:MAG: hypothetical protein SVU88_01285 [Candidatus Nanohaloarchaea archaeon]|nr:hypothetical protein [Candidatus Nanohaloarchaea archaeon]